MISKTELIEKIKSKTEENQQKIRALEEIIDNNISQLYTGCETIASGAEEIRFSIRTTLLNFVIVNRLLKMYKDNEWQIEINRDKTYKEYDPNFCMYEVCMK